jgi:hypothetical protein
MPVHVRGFEKSTITIDGEPVTLRIKRMTLGEWTEWLGKFQAHSRDFVRGETALQRTRRELVEAITPEEIEARKVDLRRSRTAAAGRAAAAKTEATGVPTEPAPIVEPTDEEARATLAPSPTYVLAVYEERLSREDLDVHRREEREIKAAGDAFTRDSIAAYVSVDGQAIFDDDANVWVTTGEQLVAVFGPRTDVLSDVMQEIYLQNRLSETDKKKLSSQRASQRSSSASATAAGETPALTAASVASAATAAAAAATA